MFESLEEMLMHDCRRFPSFKNERSICFKCEKRAYCSNSALKHIVRLNEGNNCPNFIQENPYDELDIFTMEY